MTLLKDTVLKWCFLQVILEQQGFELCVPTYIQIFLFDKQCYSTTRPAVREPQIPRALLKVLTDFQLQRWGEHWHPSPLIIQWSTVAYSSVNFSSLFVSCSSETPVWKQSVIQGQLKLKNKMTGEKLGIRLHMVASCVFPTKYVLCAVSSLPFKTILSGPFSKISEISIAIRSHMKYLSISLISLILGSVLLLQMRYIN